MCPAKTSTHPSPASRSMMDTIAAAFDKQLDSLFGEEALDISTDISVLETMMAREV